VQHVGVLRLQQSISRIEAAIQVPPFYAKAASVVEQFGPTEATRITTRPQANPLSGPANRVRIARLETKEIPT
jgi:hypothetical protein